MDFHKQYRDMNENITPSDTLVQQTIAKMESGRPHRARKPLKIILAVAAALACVSTAVAANQEAVSAGAVPNRARHGRVPAAGRAGL